VIYEALVHVANGCLRSVRVCEVTLNRRVRSSLSFDLTDGGHVAQDLRAVDTNPVESRVREDIAAVFMSKWSENGKQKTLTCCSSSAFG
jgi:hypothetical protein